MEAGKLNQRITIQKHKGVTYDDYGAPVIEWEDLRSVWAEVITQGGGEFYAAQKINAETEALFRVRFADDISDTRMRIIYRTRTFDILRINEVDGKRRELLLAAKEVV